MRMLVVFGAVVLMLGAIPSGAQACGSPEDATALKKSFHRRVACEIRRAKGLPVTCTDPSATCGPKLDAFAGIVDGVSSEWRCTREILRQSRKFISRRLRELKQDKRAAQKAPKFVEKIEGRCAGESLALTGVCSSFTDPEEGALCLRGVLEELAQTGTGQTIPPNIVLVLTDDQRWDTLFAMPLLQERVIDRGLEFSNSFTSTSLCCPDRASVFTGLYAHNHGVTSNAGANVFDHNGDTIQKQLRDNAGYKTALVGKYMVGTGAALGGTPAPGWDQWHVFFDDGGFNATHGLYYNYRLSTNGVVKRYAPLDINGEPIRRHEYSTDLLRDRTVDLISTWRTEPFFIEYAPFAPHTVAFAADRHVGTFASVPLHRPPNHMAIDITGKPSWVSFVRGLSQLVGGQPGATDARRIQMLETLPAVDEAVAEISDTLEAEGLTDNTVLIFTSDNGYMWLEHWLMLKNYPYEESVRVPLALRYPARVHAPATVTEFVQPIDFYPTFAELAGIPGASVNGTSLVPLFDGSGTGDGWRTDILIEHFGTAGGLDPSAGVRTADWKLIRTDATSGVTLELYDMQADPFELTNVATVPANAATVAALSARIDQLVLE